MDDNEYLKRRKAIQEKYWKALKEVEDAYTKNLIALDNERRNLGEKIYAIPCDDDHFASSEIRIEPCYDGLKGIWLEMDMQMGKPNRGFLRPYQMKMLIKAFNTIIENIEGQQEEVCQKCGLPDDMCVCAEIKKKENP